jgi:hypothetical protein
MNNRIIGDFFYILIFGVKCLCFTAKNDEEVLDDIRVSTNGNYVFGTERFKDEISGN